MGVHWLQGSPKNCKVYFFSSDVLRRKQMVLMKNGLLIKPKKIPGWQKRVKLNDFSTPDKRIPTMNSSFFQTWHKKHFFQLVTDVLRFFVNE